MSHDDQIPPENENEALKAFKAKEERELEGFEEKQAHELERFEEKELEELKVFEAEHRHFDIKIDRTVYTVKKEHLTGLEVRNIPEVPIGLERDLFEVKPGGSDLKIQNDTVVKIHDGLRFFTAPAQINPGRE